MASLLVDSLKQHLDPSIVQALEDNDSLRNEAEQYLGGLLANDLLFSTEQFTAATSSLESRPPTLVEEIAELDQALRQIDLKLAQTATENGELIVDVSRDLDTVASQLDSRLKNETLAILSSLRDIAHNTSSGAKHAQKQLSSGGSGSDVVSASAVLLRMDSVLDVLELPTLCRLCIMQGNYHEALEVAMLVKMHVINFPKLATFKALDVKIDAELRVMVKGLVKLLNTNLKQSNILKIFQILNRPNLIALSTQDGTDSGKLSPELRERALKIIYLNSRFKFITSETSTLKPLLKLNKISYLKRFIEVYREHLFNSLSIYHAIFRTAKLDSDADRDHILVLSYVRSLVNLLLVEVRAHLPQSSLKEDDFDFISQRDGVILQLIYLCKSLDKYKLDFESTMTQELCCAEPVVVSEVDWARNLSKVKKFRSS